MSFIACSSMVLMSMMEMMEILSSCHVVEDADRCCRLLPGPLLADDISRQALQYAADAFEEDLRPAFANVEETGTTWCVVWILSQSSLYPDALPEQQGFLIVPTTAWPIPNHPTSSIPTL